MSVDISKIRLGDEVTVRGWFNNHAADAPGASVYVTISDNCQGYVAADAIVSHTPKALAVGDFVWGTSTKRNGKVIATHEDLAWVEFEDGRHEVLLPGQWERAS